MQLWFSLCLCASVVTFSGCILRGKPKVAAGPPPPMPAATAPAAPPEPVSIPQTQVQLPPPQPVNPEALETAGPPEESGGAPQPPRPPRRAPAPTPAPASQPKGETPAPPPAAAPVEPPRATIHEIVPPIEQKRLQESAQASKREIQRIVGQARTHRLSKQDRTLVDLILSFVKLSDDAERRGDMRQADELAARGLVLAKELPGGK